MARPREPIDLIAAKGRKHLTKSEIEVRRAEEIKAPSNRIRAPSYLPQKLKREFNRISKQLCEIGIMTNLDVGALAQFVYAQELYIQLSNQLVEQPKILMSDKYPQIANNQQKFFAQCQSAARELGLTISSRCRLVMPEVKKENDADKRKRKFENEMFG